MTALLMPPDPGQTFAPIALNAQQVAYEAASIRHLLSQAERPLQVVRVQGHLGVCDEGAFQQGQEAAEWVGSLPALPAHRLGDPQFRAAHGLHFAYMTGAMANGIASEELVIAMGQAGMLGSFGAAGLVPGRIEAAIQRIQQALPQGPYAFNLIHSPSEYALERNGCEPFLRYGVRTVEASA